MNATESEIALDQVLSRAAGGDAPAWRVLVEAYTGRVYGLVMRQCNNRELAEEITQATFVKVVTRLKDYQEQGKFESWLFRIAINQLRDEMRRRKRQAQTMDMSGGGGEEKRPWAGAELHAANSSGAENPLEQASRAEQVQLLLQAVKQLNEADQEVLYLRHTAGLSFPQIAQTLEQPLGTVLARGHRALAKLRSLLRREEVSES